MACHSFSIAGSCVLPHEPAPKWLVTKLLVLCNKQTTHTKITHTLNRLNIKGNEVTKHTTVVLFIDQFRTNATDPIKVVNKAVIPTENWKGKQNLLSAPFTCHNLSPINHSPLRFSRASASLSETIKTWFETSQNDDSLPTSCQYFDKTNLQKHGN